MGGAGFGAGAMGVGGADVESRREQSGVVKHFSGSAQALGANAFS